MNGRSLFRNGIPKFRRPSRMLAAVLSVALLLFSAPLCPEPTEENFDEMFLEERTDEEPAAGWFQGRVTTEVTAGEAKYVEDEASRRGLERSDRFRNTGVVSGLGRLRLQGSYEKSRLKAKGDVSLQTPLHGSGFLPTRENPGEILDAWIGYGGPLRFRAGVIRRNWGVADLFRVVNYTDTLDLREFLLAERDSLYRGVPSADMEWIHGDHSVEAVVVAKHSPDPVPGDSSWWRTGTYMNLAYGDPTPLLPPELRPHAGVIVPRQIALPSGFVDRVCSLPGYLQPANPALAGAGAGYACRVVPVERRETALSLRSSHTAWAIRGGGKNGTVDWHITGFEGPPSEPYRMLHFESSAGAGGVPVPVVEERFERERRVGGDLALALKRGTLRGELSYTGNRYGTAVDRFGQLVRKRSGETGYVAGGDLLFRANRTRLFVEWSDRFRTDTNFLDDSLTDLLMLGAENTSSDGNAGILAFVLFRPVQGDPARAGHVNLWWRFHPSWKAETGVILFYTSDDALFRGYARKDVLYVRLHAYF